MRSTSTFLAALGLLLAAAPGWGEAASVTAPPRVAAGSTLEVGWSGPAASGDFVSIDAAGAAEASYGPYAYPSAGNPLSLRAPDEPGNYEVRYHSGAAGYAVLARAPLAVEAVTATLEADASVAAGGTLRVAWRGPNSPGDFISIDPQGAGERDYGNYAYPANGNPIELKAPDAPGDYALRYHLGQSYRVIGSRPLRVGAVGATLEHGASAIAGSGLSVTWSGPGNPGDFVSIDASGAAERDYGNYAYAVAGKPLEIRVPDEPGDYLVRYHLAASYGVIGSSPLRVEPATASLTAPASVTAGSVFEVGWKGPNNSGDFITLIEPAAADGKYGPANGYTQRGNPVRLEAPRKAGDYELRYLTGQSYRTLAKASLRVTPSAALAQLRVVTDAASAGSAFAAVEFVLDASGSMLQRLGGVRRIEIAKTALVELASKELPDGTAFALRVFGHKEAGSCRTDLELPLAPIDRGAAMARIQTLGAMNLAKTPIGASLLKVREDLAGVTGAALVVLVTDGEETCDGDPKAAIQALRAAGLDVRVNVVGFAVDEVVLKETFREWAQLGGGGFFDAQDGAQLSSALRATLQPSYEVLADGKRVATGTVNGEPSELAAGSYRVRLLGGARRDLGEVVLEAGTPRELRY
jgi:Mg-chelatase subunit ChlD